MRKNRLFILGIFTVMVALVSLSLVSGTWAKYTSTVSGSDSARVAKWAFTTVDLAHEKVEFNLFNSIKDSNGTDAETDVAANLIAPGTSGSFSFSVKNESEVNAVYTVAYTSNEAGVPLVFSTDGSSWVGTLEELNVTDAAFDMGDTVNITVHWKWAFEGGEAAGWQDSNDTSLGTTGTAEPTVAISLTFTQVD